MFRSRSWFGSTGLWKPKNPHSLEHLKYLYNVLSKNQTVSENNRSLLVETLRSIAEILIWGDQNDSTVFEYYEWFRLNWQSSILLDAFRGLRLMELLITHGDVANCSSLALLKAILANFFLEKNMLSFFLKIMKQKCGSYVCVQLLQTLNILFENIRNETSLYYLLSNNHVNSIIVHKFDFSDEEVMAYYISFLKTLSLKLNSHTIHFFYNEHTHDFPLYTEAIKFFNNSESMVRIAVRTLTLNVYRIHDKSMLKFIRDRTAAPYFSNLVWFIGNHVYELDGCIRDNAEHEARVKLADLVAEHLDHLHYLNDILCLEIDDLNQVLTEHLLQRLFIPLYVTSLDKSGMDTRSKPPKVSSILSLFLLSQVFLIMTHAPLVRLLANILINGNEAVFQFKAEVIPPKLRLSITESPMMDVNGKEEASSILSSSNENIAEMPMPNDVFNEEIQDDRISSSSSETTLERLRSLEELFFQRNPDVTELSHRIILASILESMDAVENDYAPLFALCLFHAIYDNRGIDGELLNTFFYGGSGELENDEGANRRHYNGQLVDRLVSMICLGVKYESKIRVITLQLLSSLLLRLAMRDLVTSCLDDSHLALIEGAREENILLLQNYYKMDEMFLEVFEDEYLEMSAAKTLSIEHLMMDSNLLLPPVGSPLTGIAFDKRLPCGEVERSRHSIRVYFLLRKLSLTLRSESEKYLPLTNPQNCVHIDDNLDLTNSDMLSCVVITRDNVRTRRYLVTDVFQLILVDPSSQMGWGIVKFVGFLQDIEVLGDKDDSRCLHITVKTSPTNQRGSQSKIPLLAAKFMFDDHIRCMAAKQRLVKGKQKARQGKLHLIAKLLDLTGSSPSPQLNLRRPNRRPVNRSDRPLYTPISRTLPGLAMPVKSDTLISPNQSTHLTGGRRRSREASPSLLSRAGGSIPEEEIPLGNIRNPVVRTSGHLTSRPASRGSEINVNARHHSTNSSSSRYSLDVGHRSPANQTVVKSDVPISPPDFPPVSPPQTETSFSTLTTTAMVAGSSVSSPHLNSTGGARRIKGVVETV